MTAPTPTGPISLPIYLTRRMLALSDTFRTATGSANSTEAEEHIFVKECDGSEARPCAVLSMEGLRFNLIAGGDQNVLRSSGTVFVWLALDTLEADYEDNYAAFIRFGNFLGGVASDVAALAGRDQTADATIPDSHLSLTNIHTIGPSESPKEEWEFTGRFWWGALILEWGDE